MEPHGFNNLDYIVIGIILLSGLLALMRGFMRELFSLVAWVGAYFATVHFYTHAVPLAKHYFKHNDQAAEWAAMAGVFIITLILLMIVGGIICSFIKGRTLTAIDRSLGFLYGLARGIVVVGLVYLGLASVVFPDIDQPSESMSTLQAKSDDAANKPHSQPPELLTQAKTRPALRSIAAELRTLLPQQIIDETLKGVEKQKKDLEKSAREKGLDDIERMPQSSPATSQP